MEKNRFKFVRQIFIILLLTIGMNRAVHPISRENSALLSFHSQRNLNERNIVMQTELIEQWKPIKNYEGLYEISNFGRVKSLPKRCITNTGGVYNTPERILKPFTAESYHRVGLLKSGIQKTHTIHRLVWDAFGDGQRDGRKIQVDHIDEDKSNNRIDNLQLLTCRQNNTKHQTVNKNKSSKYVGVSYHKIIKLWASTIYYNGKKKHLGYFENEYLAAQKYQEALNGLG